MKRVFKVKNADLTIRDVFLNGLKQNLGEDFELTKTSIKFKIGLDKREQLKFVQEHTIIV